jgi:sugar lactone lactonase YvrE
MTEPNGPRTLLTGRGLLESPRWHGDRLYFSDWSAGEVLAVDLAGRSEVIARVRSLPLCTAWLPDGRLLIVSSPDGMPRGRTLPIAAGNRDRPNFGTPHRTSL